MQRYAGIRTPIEAMSYLRDILVVACRSDAKVALGAYARDLLDKESQRTLIKFLIFVEQILLAAR